MKRFLILMIALAMIAPAFATQGTIGGVYKNVPLPANFSKTGALVKAVNLGVSNDNSSATAPTILTMGGIPFSIDESNLTGDVAGGWIYPTDTALADASVENFAKSGYLFQRYTVNNIFPVINFDDLEIGATYELEVFYIYANTWDTKVGFTAVSPSFTQNAKVAENNGNGYKYLTRARYTWTTDATEDSNSDGYAEFSFNLRGNRDNDQDKGDIVGYQLRRIDQDVAALVSPASGTVNLIKEDAFTLDWTSTAADVASYNVYYGPAGANNEPNSIDTVTPVNVAYTDGTGSITPTVDYDTTYFWRVDQVLSDTSVIRGDTWVFNVADNIPQIVTNPADLTVDYGDAGSMSVTDLYALSYQWYKYVDGISDTMVTDNARISGATTAEITFTAPIFSDEGDYYCVITDGVDEAQSDVATVTINVSSPSYKYMYPAGTNANYVEDGDNVLSATVIEGATYQWYRYVDGISDIILSDGADFTGTATADLTFVTVELADEGEYYCVVSDVPGSTKTLANSTVDVREMIAYYPLDVDGTDALGNYNMTLIAGATDPNVVERWAGNNAFEFDGTQALAYDFAEAFTPNRFAVSIWAKATVQSQAGYTGIFSTDISGGSASDFQIECDNGTWDLNSTGGALTLGNVVEGEWVHIVINVYESVTWVRFNGESVGSVAAAPKDIKSFAIGTNRGVNILFSGEIDEVKIFDYTLSAKEILDLANYDPELQYTECVDRPEFDVSGPEGTQDCKFDIYDLNVLMADWLGSGIYAGI